MPTYRVLGVVALASVVLLAGAAALAEWALWAGGIAAVLGALLLVFIAQGLAGRWRGRQYIRLSKQIRAEICAHRGEWRAIPGTMVAYRMPEKADGVVRMEYFDVSAAAYKLQEQHFVRGVLDEEYSRYTCVTQYDRRNGTMEVLYRPPLFSYREWRKQYKLLGGSMNAVSQAELEELLRGWNAGLPVDVDHNQE